MVGLAVFDERPSTHKHRPFLGNLQTEQRLHQRRFAGPAATDQGDRLAGPEGKRRRFQVQNVDTLPGTAVLDSAYQINSIQAQVSRFKTGLLLLTAGQPEGIRGDPEGVSLRG